MFFYLGLHKDKNWRAVVCADLNVAISLFGEGVKEIVSEISEPDADSEPVWNRPNVVFQRTWGQPLGWELDPSVGLAHRLFLVTEDRQPTNHVPKVSILKSKPVERYVPVTDPKWQELRLSQYRRHVTPSGVYRIYSSLDSKEIRHEANDSPISRITAEILRDYAIRRLAPVANDLSAWDCEIEIDPDRYYCVSFFNALGGKLAVMRMSMNPERTLVKGDKGVRMVC